MEHEALRTAYARAAEEPEFVADIEAVARDFAPLDEEIADLELTSPGGPLAPF